MSCDHPLSPYCVPHVDTYEVEYSFTEYFSIQNLTNMTWDQLWHAFWICVIIVVVFKVLIIVGCCVFRRWRKNKKKKKAKRQSVNVNVKFDSRSQTGMMCGVPNQMSMGAIPNVPYNVPNGGMLVNPQYAHNGQYAMMNAPPMPFHGGAILQGNVPYSTQNQNVPYPTQNQNAPYSTQNPNLPYSTQNPSPPPPYPSQFIPPSSSGFPSVSSQPNPTPFTAMKPMGNPAVNGEIPKLP